MKKKYLIPKTTVFEVELKKTFLSNGSPITPGDPTPHGESKGRGYSRDEENSGKFDDLW